MNIQEIISIRRHLHKHPEISNCEYKTSEYITNYLNNLNPQKTISIQKTGKAFVFNGEQEGPTIVFRAELDALQIQENTDLYYSSVHNNVAHLCGHDGHMAIIAGLAKKISEKPPKKGKAVILFQPAEEIEQGAKDVVENYEFIQLNADYIFALHNIPGAEKHKIFLKNGSFAAASKGMTIKLKGKTSHAAEPEKGISPAMAISKIISQLHNLKENKSLFSDFILLTIIHIQLGEIAFGTSPAEAQIMITLRTFENNDMTKLTWQTEQICKEIATEEKLDISFSYNEVFPATVNSAECVELIQKAATENNYEIEYISTPFKWSEDFGYYTEKYKGGFFGLGAGINQPALHNANYDFPDDIIETGINMFYSIYKEKCF